MSSFGTHVVDSVELGGKFHSEMWYDTILNSVFTEQDIDTYSGWSFAGIIGDGHGHSSTNTHVNQQFQNSMNFEFSYDGGNTLLGANSYLDWAQSVSSNLYPVKVSVVPITYFVSDQNLVNQLTAAMKAYGQKSVNELKQYISSK